MKIYYMRDNHTFVPLSLNVEEALAQIRREFELGQPYGMLCSQYPGAPEVVHAGSRENLPNFEKEVRNYYKHFPWSTHEDSNCKQSDG